MKTLPCVLCSTFNNYKVLYRGNFDLGSINERVFSARRIPDGCHYRIVRCKKCGLVFSNPILEEKKIVDFYSKSNLTYGAEIENLRETYGHYLKKVEAFLPSREKLLEVGCGSGFFLEEALRQGFIEVWGVEPSIKAVKKSSPEIRKRITVGTFRPGLFRESYFDVVCFFQTLDHVVDPNEFLQNCRKILKRNGVILCITHDTDGLPTKILGERSPIFDVEHVYLFNKKTLKKLFENNGLKVIDIFNVANKYSFGYWIKMLPLNRSLKKLLERIASSLKFNGKTLELKVGNIGILAKKCGK